MSCESNSTYVFFQVTEQQLTYKCPSDELEKEVPRYVNNLVYLHIDLFKVRELFYNQFDGVMNSVSTESIESQRRSVLCNCS